MKLTEMIEVVKDFESENHTRILVGFAVASMIGSVICAFKGGSVAADILKARKLKQEENFNRVTADEISKPEYEELEKTERNDTIVSVAKAVAPALGLAAISAFLMIKAQKDNESIIESLGVSLAASKVANDKLLKSLKAQKEAEKEIVGRDKAVRIQDKATLAKSTVDGNVIKAPSEDDPNVEHLKGGSILYYDVVCDHYFWGPPGIVDRAVATATLIASSEMSVGVNEFYDAMGASYNPKFGDMFGWTADDITANGIPVSKTSCLTEDGRPAVCIDYDFRILPFTQLS